MLIWITFAFCIVATLFVTASRVLPIRVILGYSVCVDVLFTIGLFILFHGSVTGLMAATLAGLIMAITLSVGRWAIGYQRFSFSRSKLGFSVTLSDEPGKLQDALSKLRTLKDRMTRATTGLAGRFTS